MSVQISGHFYMYIWCTCRLLSTRRHSYMVSLLIWYGIPSLWYKVCPPPRRKARPPGGAGCHGNGTRIYLRHGVNEAWPSQYDQTHPNTNIASKSHTDSNMMVWLYMDNKRSTNTVYYHWRYLTQTYATCPKINRESTKINFRSSLNAPVLKTPPLSIITRYIDTWQPSS